MQTCLFACFSLLVLMTAVCLGKYPNQKPFMDMCVGRSKATCLRLLKKQCTWDESGAPDCFERSYFKLKPVRKDPLDIVVRFFEFAYGVHLSEGTNQQVHSVSSTDDCARLCLGSTGHSGIPCLSFDYYPHEFPIEAAPFLETPRAGYCVLNTANQDTARLRNSDMGWTDSELYYSSHFTHRPFSGEEGFYSLRDSRGDNLATMLDYSMGVQFNSVNLWPRSRWGLIYLSVPIEIATSYICNEPDIIFDPTPVIDPANGNSVQFSQDASVRFTGAFTPVDYDQHCIGRINKVSAAATCAESGGYLCSTDELRFSKKTKLGCNYDAFPMWSDQSRPATNASTQFVRCCTKFSVLNICPFFTKSQIDFCSSLTTETSCIQKGSGFARQTTMGIGRMREFYKAGCANGTLPCRGMLSDFRSRDSCVWCLRPGEEEGGRGECRAGNDFGVCANAPKDMQNLFTLKIKAQCDSKVVCRIATRYEEKGTLFDAFTPAPTSVSPTSPTMPIITDSPVIIPSKIPTPRPTYPTRKPTRTPTRKPSTAAPTRATSKPTASPSLSNPTSSPTEVPTRLPTFHPSHNPTRQPSGAPTTKPSKSPTVTTAKPSKNPTVASAKPSGAPTTSNPSYSPSISPTSSEAPSDSLPP